jgi:hypothetical protein
MGGAEIFFGSDELLVSAGKFVILVTQTIFIFIPAIM